ncbi:MAG: ribonuclease III domain-containing protein [Cyanobacteria bacterium J06621_11]
MNTFPLPKFNNPKLLKQALTHRSLNNHNERLEFIGDGILQGIVTARLSQRFSKASEGVLTQKRSALVCNKTLADIARKISLGKHLHMLMHAEKQGCRKSSGVLSDALEAVIGAYFVDSGYNYKKVESYTVRLFKASRLGQL